MKSFKAIICLVLVALCLTLSCCGEKSTSLTAEYTRSSAVPVYNFYSDEDITPENYAKFADAYKEIAAKLLIESNAALSPIDDERNSVVVSPLSLYTALSMTANGTSGKTLQELETALGQGMDVSDINACIHYLNSRIQALNSDEGKVTTANSIWIDEDFSVKGQFLQTVVNYFDAEVFRTKLDADNGAEEVNKWISKNTDGEIDNLINNFGDDAALALVNALLFDDNWVTPYEENDLSTGTFNGTNGSQDATFMSSNEMLIKSADAKGFVKSYKNTPCKFVAILPNEGINLEDYINSLSGAKLTTIMDSISGVNRCVAEIPEFELRTTGDLKNAVNAIGCSMVLGEDANFGGLTMSDGLYISDVLQESFIKVHSDGTKAGSASAVGIRGSASPEDSFETLTFDRPFLFMIVENEYNLPLFIGTIQDL